MNPHKCTLIEMNVLLFAVALTMFCSHMTEGIKSSCKSVPVNEGEDTNITCHFAEDISKIQKDVKLYHDKDTVLTIAWNEGFPDIHSKAGYQFDGRITTNLTVRIPRAQTENGGKYTCQVVLSKAFEATPCTLVISNRCAVNGNFTEKELGTTGCKHESQVDERFEKIVIAAIAVLGVSLALSICANVCLLFKIKRMKQKHQTVSTEQSKLLLQIEKYKDSETQTDLSKQDIPDVCI